MAEEFPLVFSITSGKGGVGKTSIAVNIACALAAEGKKVILFDADLGLANVDVMLGMTPEKNVFHLLYEGLPLDKVLIETPYKFHILPASSGITEMLTLSTGQKLELIEALDALENMADYFIIDTGAGINDTVVYFNIAVQEQIVVLTPEPTSLTDAYALIKVLHTKYDIDTFRILVNMAQDVKSAKEIFSKLYMACEHFLKGVSLDFVGFIPRDTDVRKAVMEQKPFYIESKDSMASTAVRDITQTIRTWDISKNLDGNIKFFWKKLLLQE